ncbi:adenine phosphoribosyltransferase [Anaerofustis stercorihominis]|uniref:Adenine phosphoribosyltransferase n=1 Tax=Anaerofustis stercorihominis DSM 17244 TaxID=445971 RepID=B1C9H4_9FIRM|nr:adenine phosphoribosyltransferase [Anaerofustis stercorihominis]EDS72545.1 adenine phosphoribosyltransferase [Anaerofustis stercorihominis DSM 17244]MCQ4795221.1 adenine phosphoribosyltransferase [Anaerofustis stercorihominis]
MDLKEKIRVIEDFPKEGISFKDITTLVKDKEALQYTINALCDLIDGEVDLIVGPESRGFIFGTAVAYRIGAGFVPVRKPGKLPAETISYTYDLEYGTDTIEIHKDAIKKGDKVVIIDDLIATGGTLEASAKAIEMLGGEIVSIISLMELTGLNGRDKLKDYDVKTLVQYEF